MFPPSMVTLAEQEELASDQNDPLCVGTCCSIESHVMDVPGDQLGSHADPRGSVGSRRDPGCTLGCCILRISYCADTRSCKKMGDAGSNWECIQRVPSVAVKVGSLMQSIVVEEMVGSPSDGSRQGCICEPPNEKGKCAKVSKNACR